MNLEAIQERVEEEGECWHWTGYGGKNGHHPQVKIDGSVKLVRRLAYAAKRGEIKDGLRVVPVCDNPKCINPDHQRCLTEAQKGKRAAKKGAFSSPLRGQKIANARRQAAGTKLTMEQAREIRMSTESGPVLAARYGINRSLVGCIRRNERWQDYSNPFVGLMA